MNFDSTLEQLNLDNVSRSDIKTFSDFSILAEKVRNEIDTTRDLDLVYRYYDIMLYLIKEFPINKKHYSYFTQKSDIEILSKYPEASILEEYHKTVKGILENNSFRFNAEVSMRPLETIFGYEENLVKPSFKSSYVSKETFQTLIDKFWHFVEFSKEKPALLQ